MCKKFSLCRKIADSITVMRKEDRKRNILILVICLAWMMPPWTVWGQETTAGNSTGISARAGYIVFSDGGGFEIVRDGQKRYYDPLVDYVEGTELHFGDYINTYEHAFLEILLEPGDRIIKVSEQTSFSIPKGSSAEDVGSLRLTYGRVRARVTKLAGDALLRCRDHRQRLESAERTSVSMS